MSTDNFKHLGHWIGFAPTSAEMGLFFKPKGEQNELTVTDNLSGATEEGAQDQESGVSCDGTGKQEGAETAQG